MSVTEKHVYNVEGFGHWLAKDAQQARRAALIGVTAKRLTGGEIIALPPGSINDAETTLAKAGQPDLPFEQHDPAPAISQAEAEAE